MFSFVKELNDESAELLKQLNDRQSAWQRQPRVLVWAFWMGDDLGRANKWAEQHGIDNIVFAVVLPDDPLLADWNISPQAPNTLVLACRGNRIMASYAALKAKDIPRLESQLPKLLATQKRD